MALEPLAPAAHPYCNAWANSAFYPPRDD